MLISKAPASTIILISKYVLDPKGFLKNKYDRWLKPNAFVLKGPLGNRSEMNPQAQCRVFCKQNSILLSWCLETHYAPQWQLLCKRSSLPSSNFFKNPHHVTEIPTSSTKLGNLCFLKGGRSFQKKKRIGFNLEGTIFPYNQRMPHAPMFI